jgi:lysophospholipase L1-like esterase
VKLGGAARPILPWIAVKYFAILLACVAVLIGVVEFRLSRLAQAGRVNSQDWQNENAAINRMNAAKIKADARDPVWRSEGMPLPAAKDGKRRILVIGDSFVWGDGYANANDIWWRQLQRELRRRGYGNVEVVAAGLNGASAQDQLHWLRDLGLLERVVPDLVVLGYVTNDPDTQDQQGRYRVKQIGRDVKRPRWRGLDRTLGRVAPNLAAQFKQQLVRKWESRPRDAYPYAQWELKLLEPPNLDAYREVVMGLGEFMRQAQVPMFAVTLPNSPLKDHFEARHQPVVPVFAAAGLPFYDLLDDFLRAFPAKGEILQWGINPANGHPGRVSTRFYAVEVADILERDYLGRLGPKSGDQPVQPNINDWMPPAARVRRIGGGDWELSYPEPGAAALTLPLGKPYVQLAFAEPVAIRSVSIAGAGLRESELHLATIDPATGVERKEPQALGSRSGPQAAWPTAGVPGADEVNALALAAQFDARFDSAPNGAEARVLKLHIDFEAQPNP